MCLKQRRVVKRNADSNGDVAASNKEKTRIEKRGPLYWKWIWSRMRKAGEKIKDRKIVFAKSFEA